MHGGNGIKKLAEVVHKGRLDILSYYTLYKRKKKKGYRDDGSRCQI